MQDLPLPAAPVRNTMFKSFFLIYGWKYFLFKEDFFKCYIFLNKN